MIDLSNKTYSRLTLQWPVGRYGSNICWLALCVCGRLKIVRSNSLRTGDIVSCGCLRLEKHTTHGHAHTGKQSSLYKSWASMLQRCNNPNNPDYHHYGGRGIKVCKRWTTSFENFQKDMGPRPIGLSIDRRNNNGNYTRGNCRWATQKQQRNNQRNRIYTNKVP
jgi:hypothetical protein